MPWLWVKSRPRPAARRAAPPCTAALRTVRHRGVSGIGPFAETVIEDEYHRCTWGSEHPGWLHVTKINGRPVWFQ